MTAKQKANELGNLMYNGSVFDYDKQRHLEELENAKRCALIAVQNIINSNPHSNPFNTEVYSTMDYWESVKTEIEKL